MLLLPAAAAAVAAATAVVAAVAVAAGIIQYNVIVVPDTVSGQVLQTV